MLTFVTINGKYKHKKTGNLYKVLDIVIDATNGERNGKRLVLYTRADTLATSERYARDEAEFMDGRFEPVSEP